MLVILKREHVLKYPGRFVGAQVADLVGLGGTQEYASLTGFLVMLILGLWSMSCTLRTIALYSWELMPFLCHVQSTCF